MTIKLVCNFSAEDVEFPFTVGKIYESTDDVKGFNHLSTHILCDNAKSTKVETGNIIIDGELQWVIKDNRSYSKYSSYARFSVQNE